MANFNQHRTQVAIGQIVKDSQPVKISNINSKLLLLKSNEQIMDYHNKEFDKKLENSTNQIRQQFEDQYRAKIQELEATTSQQENLIREQEAKLNEQEEQITKKERKIGKKERKISKQEGQIDEQSQKIDKKRQKISTLKEQVKNYNITIGNMEEEQKKREIEVEKEKDQFKFRFIIKF